MRIDTTDAAGHEAPYELVKTMRASVLVLGPLVARHGQGARVAAGRLRDRRASDRSAPQGAGGDGRAHRARARATSPPRARRLRGASIVFDMVTVTGTENLMMAAALARGRTTLENAAREPEVEELGRVLNKMGARITGAGTSLITIDGVEELTPIEHSVIPDRIEAGTLLVAAAITGGNVLLRDCLPEHLDAVIAKLRAAGAEVAADGDGIRVRGKAEFRAGRRLDPAVPRLPDRHAGAVHGADDARARPVGAVARRSSRTASCTCRS